MGRPSLVHVRRAQILEAVRTCILEHGLANTTLARIAEIAGVQTSLVSHYFGSREAVLSAAVDQILETVSVRLQQAVAAYAPERRLGASIEAMFSGGLNAIEIVKPIDLLVAESHFNESTRQKMQRLFSAFEAMLRDAADAALPHAPPARRAELAFVLLCLGQGAANLAARGIVDATKLRQARAAADRLVAEATAAYGAPPRRRRRPRPRQ